MSRIGKQKIKIPEGVSVLQQGQYINIKGQYGQITKFVLPIINIVIDKNELIVLQESTGKFSKAYHGLIRALLYNAIVGVNKLFSKTLILEGVGYKFQVLNSNLVLAVGFTHLIQLKIPENIRIKLESANKIIVESIEKDKLGLFASSIRNIKPPEPYKGKGIRYIDELINRKAGKIAKTSK